MPKKAVQITPRFWATVWEEDIRGPLRDFIRQVLFLAFTGLLQLCQRAFEATGVRPWVGALITNVFDGLTVVAVASVAIVILVGMVASTVRALRKHD